MIKNNIRTHKNNLVGLNSNSGQKWMNFLISIKILVEIIKILVM